MILILSFLTEYKYFLYALKVLHPTYMQNKKRRYTNCATTLPCLSGNAKLLKTTGLSKFQRIQFLETGNSHARNSPVKFQKFRLFFEFRYHFSYDCGCFFIFLRHEGVGISFGSMVGIGYLDSATWGVKSKNSF